MGLTQNLGVSRAERRVQSYRALQLTSDLPIRTYRALGKLLQTTKDLGDEPAGATFERTIFTAPDTCTLNAIGLVVTTAVAIDAANFVTLEVIDKGTDGTGSTVIASMTTDSGDADPRALAASVNELFTNLAPKILLQKDQILNLKGTSAGSGKALDDLVANVGYQMAGATNSSSA